MSKWGAKLPHIRGRSREILVFIPGNMFGARIGLTLAAAPLVSAVLASAPHWLRGTALRGFAASGVLAAAVPRTASAKPGGAYRDRTDDLKLAKLALSQLS